MRSEIQISAVIPTYNREKTIGRAIDSALAQQFPPSEIIIVDDGSEDGTRELVERYGRKCRYFYQENAGVSSARNRGVCEAKCKWIAFLDSDDYWAPQHLMRMAEAIDATKDEAALYFCDARLPPEAGGLSYWDSSGLEIDEPFLFKRDASSWALMTIQPIGTLGDCLRASELGRIRFYSSN
jgi:glycosyltransferase involved in cell wall biosynthesis